MTTYLVDAGLTPAVAANTAAIAAQTASALGPLLVAQAAVLKGPAAADPTSANLFAIDNNLFWIAESLATIAKNSQIIAGNFTKIETGLANMANATREQSLIQQTALTEQLQKNEFNKRIAVQALTDAERPVPADLTPKELVAKIEKIVKDTMAMTPVLTASSYFSDMTSSIVTNITNYFKSTAVFTGATALLDDLKKSYVLPMLISVETTAKAAATKIGLIKTKV